MPCDSKPFRPEQSLSDRKAEVKRVVDLVASEIVAGRVVAKIGPNGAIAFQGLTEAMRRGVTDSCVARRIMSGTNALAKQQMARAEMLAGRRVDMKALAGGHHGHFDSSGNVHWHGGHK